MDDQKKKKKKIHFTEYKCNSIKWRFGKICRKFGRHPTPENITFQTNFLYILNNIETYGFKFAPTHYVLDDIKFLEGILTDRERGE